MKIVAFKTRDERSPQHCPLHLRRNPNQHMQYIGSLRVKWDFRPEDIDTLDVYVDFDHAENSWYPFVHLYGSFSHELFFLGDADKDHGTVQPAVSYLTEYVNTHWWTIITRVPLYP